VVIFIDIIIQIWFLFQIKKNEVVVVMPETKNCVVCGATLMKSDCGHVCNGIGDDEL
jgi:hypothetical protein